MPINDPDELDNVDQQIRINELKARAEELTGGKMTAWESADCPPDLAEQFWKHVVDFEQAPETTHLEVLKQAGVELPPPDSLTDRQLHAKLWEVINALASANTFLLSTNHLSDRELYIRLWSDVLHESTYAGMDCYLDLVSSGSDEDIDAWLRFYADDDTRRRWRRDFPDSKVPRREKPPFDRDRRLPKAGRE